MSAVIYKASRDGGSYVKATIVPANHSEQSHFGLVDGAIIGFLLLCAAGLVCLFLLG
jgi:hypothetical protein